MVSYLHISLFKEVESTQIDKDLHYEIIQHQTKEISICFILLVPKSLSPLLKFLSINTSNDESDVKSSCKILFPNSPCPSPTPIFQQLYLALANWERLSESPDCSKLSSHSQNDDVEPEMGKEKIVRSNSVDSSNINQSLAKVVVPRRKSNPVEISRAATNNEMEKQSTVQIRINSRFLNLNYTSH